MAESGSIVHLRQLRGIKISPDVIANLYEIIVRAVGTISFTVPKSKSFHASVQRIALPCNSLNLSGGHTR